MATDQTDLTMFTGKVQDLRAETTAPTEPTPVTGDIYINKSGGNKLCFYAVNTWTFINLAAQ